MPAAAHTPSTTRATRVRAHWFDGHSSRARPALITLLPGPGGPDVLLTALDTAPGTAPLRMAHRDVGWPERWSASHDATKRSILLDLHAHGSAQIDDLPAWQAALAAAGRRATLAERMQTQWRTLLMVLLLAVIGLWAFYRWGTPWTATQLTRVVPLRWEQALTQHAMTQIDSRYLKPSELPTARQTKLRAGFDKLAAAVRTTPTHQPYGRYAPTLTLHFRSGLGANAFALPGGVIVMTDDLVKKADELSDAGDAALLGVLAHEIGHVQHRHGTRVVVEQSVLNIGLGLALGDVSALVSTGASILTSLSYSRGHERQADCYAINLLRATDMPAAPMGTLLLAITSAESAKVQASDPRAQTETKAQPEPASTSDSIPSRGLDWLSTHPDTVARAERLRAGDTSGCE